MAKSSLFLVFSACAAALSKLILDETGIQVCVIFLLVGKFWIVLGKPCLIYYTISSGILPLDSEHTTNISTAMEFFPIKFTLGYVGNKTYCLPKDSLKWYCNDRTAPSMKPNLQFSSLWRILIKRT